MTFYLAEKKTRKEIKSQVTDEVEFRVLFFRGFVLDGIHQSHYGIPNYYNDIDKIFHSRTNK